MNKITRFLSLCCAVAVLAGISGAGVLSARASTDNGQTAETTAETAAETMEAPVKPAPTEFAHIYECAISGDQIVIDGQMEGSFPILLIMIIIYIYLSRSRTSVI